MAKKQKTEKAVEPLIEKDFEEVVVKTPVMEKPAPVKKKNTWEIKDRTYFLNDKREPLSYIIKSANVYWFDKDKGYEREIKYCENQTTCFVDEMKGDQRLAHVIFRGGSLVVPKEKTVLQKFLSLYHPHRNKLFREWQPEVKASHEVDFIEMEIEALNAAQSLDIDMAEAVLRVEIGSKVSEMSSKEIKRDLLLYAKRNPELFLELADDENVMLRNFGIKAVEAGILRLSSDQRNFLWGSNGRKVMVIPFDEHPYTALAHWFKTDEGMEIYSNIEKRLN